MRQVRQFLLLLLTFFKLSASGQKTIKLSIIVTDLHLKYSLRSGTDPRIKIFTKSNDVLINPKDAEGFNCLHLIDYKLPDASFEYALNNIEWDLTNGSFTVNVTQGMGTFKYVLTNKDGKEISNSDRTASPSNTFTNLTPGDYKLLVYSNGNDSCKPQEKLITIESAITTIQAKLVKNVPATCEDCKTGSLQFTVQDYKGALQYSLTNTINNQVNSNSIGLFEQLPVGKYKLQLKKSDNNCADLQMIDEVFTGVFTPVIPAVDTTKKPINIDSAKKN